MLDGISEMRKDHTEGLLRPSTSLTFVDSKCEYGISFKLAGNFQVVKTGKKIGQKRSASKIVEWNKNLDKAELLAVIKDYLVLDILKEQKIQEEVCGNDEVDGYDNDGN
jgi:hypothetical protein